MILLSLAITNTCYSEERTSNEIRIIINNEGLSKFTNDFFSNTTDYTDLLDKFFKNQPNRKQEFFLMLKNLEQTQMLYILNSQKNKEIVSFRTKNFFVIGQKENELNSFFEEFWEIIFFFQKKLDKSPCYYNKSSVLKDWSSKARNCFYQKK